MKEGFLIGGGLIFAGLTRQQVNGTWLPWVYAGFYMMLAGAAMCWWGINYLPSDQGSSVHTYSTSE